MDTDTITDTDLDARAEGCILYDGPRFEAAGRRCADCTGRGTSPGSPRCDYAGTSDHDRWQRSAVEDRCLGCEGHSSGGGCAYDGEYTPSWAACRGGGGRPLDAEAVVIELPRPPCVVGSDGTAVPSDEQALCADCGARGWVSDWPGEGALCASAHGGDLVCDDCEDARETARETGREVV